LALFESPERVLSAAAALRSAGYRDVEAFTPFPVEGLAEALGHRPPTIARYTLLGGILGALGAFFLQYYAAVVHLPINIGGRPLNSWPAFVPITFELTVLTSAFFTLFGLLAQLRLPDYDHPLLDNPVFARASQDAYVLVVRSRDPKFKERETAALLRALGGVDVSEVLA
jgi:hypothetical protein